MSSLLPDYTSLNTVLATLTNPAVTGLYLRRSLVCSIGALCIVGGFGLLIAGSKPGQAVVKTAIQAGAAVATDGVSLAATGAAKVAKGAANAAG